MRPVTDTPLVTTRGDRCRVCYTCVRECPAKAIRIAEGQAEVLSQRCIGCGNCVRVCSQHAKCVRDSKMSVEALLRAKGRVAACVAPSFPAAFGELDYQVLVGMMRALGFDVVAEVAFGADLVARRYRELLAEPEGKRFIATTCPAIVAYVERYHPHMVHALAPVVSPMIAMARVLRQLHGNDMAIVFVGPCVAKKGEAASEGVAGEVDDALTFLELKELFEANEITPDTVSPSEFDPPAGGPGALFSISRGMLQAAGIREDLLTADVVAAEGTEGFVEAIREFEMGYMDARLLEVLACNGCIMGPGIDSATPQFGRRASVSRYVQKRMATIDSDAWQDAMTAFQNVDLSRGFTAFDQRIPISERQELAQIMRRMGKLKPEDELNCGACGYETCREHAIAILKGLAEDEMCLPNTIERLRSSISELAKSNSELARTQEALVQSEKLASMGQLAAGIAHELNNPLGVVLMYAHLMLDELDEAGQNAEDLKMIAVQADRCKKIVAGLLHFARQNKVLLESRNIADVIDLSLVSTHVPENIEVCLGCQLADPMVDIDQDQFVQVFTNLFGNACAAMPDGGTLQIRTYAHNDDIKIEVSDNGVGISEAHRAKIFEPFFTTKEIGEGTGLGLAVTYGIVKMHRGDIRVESNQDPDKGPTGTTFTLTLPRHAAGTPIGSEIE